MQAREEIRARMACLLSKTPRAAPTHVATSSNLVLRSLSPADQTLLETGAERLDLRRGAPLIDAGRALDALFFPESTLLAIADTSGRHAEVAVVGREGFAGWSLLLGASSASHSVAVTTRDGSVLKVRAESLQAGLSASATLRLALLRFVEVLTMQMGISILSSARDHIDARVARWLLMRHDRVGGDELLVRHEEIAIGLGVRRASVTDMLHIFEGDAMVRCKRGRILIRDRALLEGVAAQSYGTPEAYYRSLMGPFGKCTPPA